MNTDTNHLASPELMKKLNEAFNEDELSPDDLVRGEFVDPSEYTDIPEHLQGAAKKALNGKDGVFISKTSGGKLSRWAANKRKKKKQTAKASRRRNRSWQG